MWDNLFTLLSFSLVMGVASFLAGSVPLSFSLSQSHTRVISAIGTGLLVGACLIIIIPEGIETLYSAAEASSTAPASSPLDGAAGQDGHGKEPHAWVGLSLIVGFVMMYLIDKLPQHAAKLALPQRPLQISLANLSQGAHRARYDEENEEVPELRERSTSSKSSATTIGLVIHAAADGIALAASSFLSEASTGLVVFLALMIHKAPAAFGLTSVLLKQGFTKRQARTHLLVFSLAAPVGAIVTFVAVNMVAGGQLQGAEGTRFATGLLLLFSGGTFLYVAMHTMQDEHAEHEEEQTKIYANGHGFHSDRTGPSTNRPDFRDTILAVVGMLLPLLAQVGHAH